MLRLIQLNFNYFSMRYFVANWKMYAGQKQSLELAAAYRDLILPEGVKGIVAPTALAFSAVKENLVSSTWEMSAQNIAWVPEGAYTGAISAEMFSQAGANYALIGHSERRHIFGESDSDVAKKISAAVSAGLIPILCVGESLEDLEAGKRQYRLKKQLLALEKIEASAPIMVAYEPVWAIGGSGQGRRCLPADVEDVHGFIRTELATFGFVDSPILYGGSINGDNANEYLLPEVNGLLVGTASIHPEEVQKIINVLVL